MTSLTARRQQRKRDFKHVVIEVLALVYQHCIEFPQTAVSPLDPIPGFLKDQLVVILAFFLKLNFFSEHLRAKLVEVEDMHTPFSCTYPLFLHQSSKVAHQGDVEAHQ